MIRLWRDSDTQGRVIALLSSVLLVLLLAVWARTGFLVLLVLVVMLAVNAYVALKVGRSVRREREQEQAMRIVNEHEPW